MQLKTILNRVQKFKSFVYGDVQWEDIEGNRVLVVEVWPRRNSRPICSGCRRSGSGYDTLNARLFEFVPLWGIAVFFSYVMRRVDCRRCGVKVEAVPWAEGKQTLTHAYMQFLAGVGEAIVLERSRRSVPTRPGKRCSRSVEWIVEWGLAHRNLSGITALGVDELLWRKGHQYVTVVYQIDAHAKRLLWVGQDRTLATLYRFFREFGEERTKELKFICSDMWQPYLQVIATKASQALHVLDRFHIASHMNKAIDQVRAQEARELRAKGHHPVLKHSRWCLLKRAENRTRCAVDQAGGSGPIQPKDGFGVFSSKRTSSSSGTTLRRIGPAGFWMIGAPKRCVPRSNQ